MKWYRNSMAAKLLIPCAILVVICFAVMITGNAIWMARLGWDATETSSTESVKRTSAEIESYLNKYAGLAISLANTDDIIDFAEIINERSVNAYKGKPEYENFLSTVRAVAAQDERIFKVYYCSEVSQNAYTMDEWDSPEDYWLDAQEFYVEGKNANELYFSKPHEDVSNEDGHIVVSVTYPVQKDGTFLGLIGIDLSVGTIRNIVASVKSHDNEYAFLLDQAGNFVAHPDETLIMKANGTELSGKSGEVCRQMVAGKSGWELSEYNGEMQYSFYNPVKLAGWSLCVIVPEAALTTPISHHVTLSVLLGVISVVVLLSFLWFIVRRSFKPLVSLNKIIEEVAGGNLAVMIKSKSSDEIGRLTENFNEMVTKLKDLINNVAESRNR